MRSPSNSFLGPGKYRLSFITLKSLHSLSRHKIFLLESKHSIHLDDEVEELLHQVIGLMLLFSVNINLVLLGSRNPLKIVDNQENEVGLHLEEGEEHLEMLCQDLELQIFVQDFSTKYWKQFTSKCNF